MKKFMLLATAVGMTLTSCVNEVETPVESGRQVIAFDAPVMKNTRAVVKGEITDNTYPADEKFKVFCRISTGNYAGWGSATDYFKVAGGDVAKHDGSYWSTDNVYYWPDAGYSLAFSALSPAEFGTAAAATTVARTENGIQITDFVTEPVSDNQYDLMYSRTVYDKTRENSAGAAVPLLFEHALTSIVFSSQKADESVDYQITDLKVTGSFYTKGNFNQGIIETPSPYSETATPVWTGLDEKVAVNYDPNFASPAVVTTTPTIFTSGESAILPIPQDVPADAEVIVSYSKTASGTKTDHTATILLSAFRQIGDVEIKKWERGKRYVYRIAFGQNDKIYFDPSVNNWDTQPTLIYTIK